MHAIPVVAQVDLHYNLQIVYVIRVDLSLRDDFLSTAGGPIPEWVPV